MASKHLLLLLVATVAFTNVARAQATCNNMKLGAETPCCRGALVGDACGTATGLKGECILVDTSNWITQQTNPDALMCKLNTCTVDDDCLDANFCTTDTCVSGSCVRVKQRGCVGCKKGLNPGVCNDGNTCTKDSCATVALGWLTKCKHSRPVAGCVPATVPKYGQCGGLLYTGSKRCEAGSSCQKQFSYTQEDPTTLTLNPYYSQCL